jgi:hypothetical protein
MNHIGRPSSFTATKATRIVEAIRRGIPFKLAASAGGVSYNTFVRWRNEGTRPDAPRQLREFCNQVRTAESEAAQRFLGLIETAAERNWQAAAWMLERRHPELFGRSAEPPSRGMMDIDLDLHDDD